MYIIIILLLVYNVGFGRLRSSKPLWGVPLIIGVIRDKLKKFHIETEKNFKKNFSNANRPRKDQKTAS